ncbi:FUSC family protein [Pseudomonas sp. App30]|uniref:FUSC family protein n=1 Tax=Pseudomonas sp. App30 TaxID=3068990 RepID=UPI003A811A8C
MGRQRKLPALKGCLSLWPSRAAALFSAHTTAAALMALVIAQWCGLHHPWWAAMTVWLVAQPTRGLFIARIGARLAGTAVGAMVGGMLLALFFDHHVWLMMALAAWITLCAGAGNLFRHFRNYAFVLAGYTAAIVALFGILDPVFDVGLALGRLYCTVIGVLASALLSWPFTARSEFPDRLRARLETLVVAAVGYSLRRLRSAGAHDGTDLNIVLREMAEFDVLLDQVAAGSGSSRQFAACARHTLDAIGDLLIWSSHSAVGGSLRICMDVTAAMQGPAAVPTLRAVICEVCRHPQNLATGQIFVDKLNYICTSLDRPEPLRVSLATRLKQHNWRNVGVAAIRPLTAMTIATLVWWSCDWSYGPVMVMTAVLFASLFSSHKQPDAAMKDVLAGTCVGIVLGLGYRFWLLELATSPWQLACFTAPFLLVGALLMARPATAKMAIDLNMTFLLIAQPSLQTDTTLTHSLWQALAILGGVLTAVLTYRRLVPNAPHSDRLRLAQRIAVLTLRLPNTQSAAARTGLYEQIKVLLAQLNRIDKQSTALLSAAFECAAIAQHMCDHMFEASRCTATDDHLVQIVAAKLITHLQPHPYHH